MTGKRHNEGIKQKALKKIKSKAKDKVPNKSPRWTVVPPRRLGDWRKYMTSINIQAGILAALLLVGCAQNPPQPTYTEQLAMMPAPQTDEERNISCAYIRSEIARNQNIATIGSAQLQPLFALNIQIRARDNIAALEAKASEFGCTAAFGAPRAKSNIESCVAICKVNTSRTSEQCFDACNH